MYNMFKSRHKFLVYSHVLTERWKSSPLLLSYYALQRGSKSENFDGVLFFIIIYLVCAKELARCCTSLNQVFSPSAPSKSIRQGKY